MSSSVQIYSVSVVALSIYTYVALPGWILREVKLSGVFRTFRKLRPSEL